MAAVIENNNVLEFALDEDWIVRVQGEIAEKMQENLLKDSVDQVRKLISVADLLHVCIKLCGLRLLVYNLTGANNLL